MPKTEGFILSSLWKTPQSLSRHGSLSSKCNSFIEKDFGRCFPIETFFRTIVNKIGNYIYKLL